MTLPVERPIAPMLARSEVDLPAGKAWRYEPKLDGFRALVYRDEGHVFIVSRNGKNLGQYFPELSAHARASLPSRCVIDGEIVLYHSGRLNFEALLTRLGPGRRGHTLPHASFVAFDILALGDRDLRLDSFKRRRSLLEETITSQAAITLTPQTDSLSAARIWLYGFRSAGIEGVVAKHVSLPYGAGRRLMVKVRARRSLDCVVGGYVPDASGRPSVLLLGLYAEDGVLDHIGQSTVLSEAMRTDAAGKLCGYRGNPSFIDGLMPGWSRWSEQRNPNWVSVPPRVACEVSYTAVDGHRLRHSSRFLRWRDDRSPLDCSARQLAENNGRLRRLDLLEEAN